MDAIKPANPFCGFLQFLAGDTRDAYLRGNTPSVVSLVIDHDNIPRGGHLAQYLADIGLVTLGPALVYTALLAKMLLSFPVQLVPVADKDPARLSLSELVYEAGWDDLEFTVVVARASW